MHLVDIRKKYISSSLDIIIASFSDSALPEHLLHMKVIITPCTFNLSTHPSSCIWCHDCHNHSCSSTFQSLPAQKIYADCIGEPVKYFVKGECHLTDCLMHRHQTDIIQTSVDYIKNAHQKSHLRIFSSATTHLQLQIFSFIIFFRTFVNCHIKKIVKTVYATFFVKRILSRMYNSFRSSQNLARNLINSSSCAFSELVAVLRPWKAEKTLAQHFIQTSTWKFGMQYFRSITTTIVLLAAHSVSYRGNFHFYSLQTYFDSFLRAATLYIQSSTLSAFSIAQQKEQREPVAKISCIKQFFEQVSGTVDKAGCSHEHVAVSECSFLAVVAQNSHFY